MKILEFGMWWPCRVWWVSGSYRHERVSNLFVFHQTSHESLSVLLLRCRQILVQMGGTQEIIKSLALLSCKMQKCVKDWWTSRSRMRSQMASFQVKILAGFFKANSVFRGNLRAWFADPLIFIKSKQTQFYQTEFLLLLELSNHVAVYDKSRR